MSSYIKLIIFIVLLILISVAVIFIDSSTDNMNKAMPEISDGIVNGDNDYNNAVELVNNKKFDEAMDNAVSAGNNYNKSLLKLRDIQNKFSSDVNGVHREYINITITELEFKTQAVDLLINAIECFEVESNDTGTDYAYEANELINKSVDYQNQRNSIVSNNPNLFKQEFSI